MTATLLVGCGTVSIPHRHNVTSNIIRGGQPTSEGWQQLYKEGVRTVVKLNEGTDNEAEQLGMTVIYLPINTWEQILTKPKLETIDSAVGALIIAEDTERKLYVHCTHGQDRTGLVVGAFRVASQNWTKEQAYKEMRAIGFHPYLLGLYWYWQHDVYD